MKTNLPIWSKAQIIGATLLALAAITASAEIEDKIAKSFQVQPGGQLVVVADRGAIEIKTADRDFVEIEITRKAGGSRTKAEQTLKDHVITTIQDGNKVEVRADYKGAKLSGWLG